MKFTVIDTKTGEYPDLWEIALKEEWAKSLCYCDMEGFAVEEDGTLILMDECGRHEYPPEDRFKIAPLVGTNADRISSMTDEELAEYLFERGNGDEYCYGICVHQDDVNACVKALKQDGCIQSVVAWLKQEYTP